MSTEHPEPLATWEVYGLQGPEITIPNMPEEAALKRLVAWCEAWGLNPDDFVLKRKVSVSRTEVR